MESKSQCVNVVASNQKSNLSRHDLIHWINSTLNIKLKNVESLCDGAVYCRLMDILFPGCLSLKRVKVDANQEHEYIVNLKQLQRSFASVGCNKEVPIDKLIKRRMQDNLEFLQWFKKFYDSNYGLQSQEAPEAVSICKSSKKTAQTSSRPVQLVNPVVSTGRPNRLESLKSEVADFQDKSERISNERDFYFNKLRHLENLCLQHTETEGMPDSQANDDETLASKILAKLYETEEGFESPDSEETY